MERGSFIPKENLEFPDEKKDPPKDLSRRGFLKMAAAGLAGLALGKEAQAGINIIHRKTLVEKAEPESQVEVVPEYERKLEKILLSVPSDSFSHETEIATQKAKVEYFKMVHRDILANLPDYTQIFIAVNEKNESAINEMIMEMGLYDRTTLNVVKNVIDEWAQDYGEVINVDGQEKFLVPMSPNNEADKEAQKRLDSRNEAIQNLYGENVLVADFYFQGGNLTFDQTDEGLRVFVGYDDVESTCAIYDRQGKVGLNHLDIHQIISKTFGGAQVVELGNEKQDLAVMHLDQSFIILADKKVVFNKVADKSKLAEQQDFIRQQLEQLGYEIIDLENSSIDLQEYRNSVNAIPYVDKNDGVRKVMYPVFPGEVNGDYNSLENISEADLQGKGLAAYKAYKKAGYLPIPIRNFSGLRRGNTHCLSNVLAKNIEQADLDKVKKKA